jgi:site-specific DNA-adenine methylase
MALKPVIKTKKSRQKVADWIVNNFPEDYRDLIYLEPFLGDGGVFLAKDKSVEEVVSDCDHALLDIWRSIRDEHKTLCSRVKRMDHSKSTFERCRASSGGDYMDSAVREFILRCMSKEGLKKTYIPRRDKMRCGECWCDVFERIPLVRDRINNCYIVDRDPIKLISSFSGSGRFVFCDIPESEDEDLQTALRETMVSFRGKAMICSRNSALNRRTYSQWNRKGLKGSRGESIWTNF